MSEYAGQQFVGIDLHRRRSVIVRATDAGERLETTRIVSDVDRSTSVIARAGESPEVVLEATYGWYWAVDAPQEAGARRSSGSARFAKAEVHAVLAKCGVRVSLTVLFGVAGTELLNRLRDEQRLPAAYAARIASLRRAMDGLDFEIDVFARLVGGRLAKDPGYVVGGIRA